MKRVGVVLGSASDFPVVEPGITLLRQWNIPVDVHILSAHRTPVQVQTFAAGARREGFGVLIAAAGMAAHLAGTLAANTTLPVIGIPCKGSALAGMDALLSTVMMPPGIPVAAVGIDGAKNAALLAIEILAVTDDALAEKLAAQRTEQAAQVLATDAEIQERYA